ncbi:trem-like transcript 1 protein [Echinops telfairi]|uniref:Trem-like transcript 1 protein n=1 Tax=Echinops telfairi TaxID=9371 RepID=A0AC55DG47_ECHTE|nr:trem-like transcript 1 protein [Echinops telfairi]
MGPNLLLLLLLALQGPASEGILPEVLQVTEGGYIQVQCHYLLQHLRAPKVWCRFLPEGCQPLLSSKVDRRAPGDGRSFLTDLGGGLLQVEMVSLREEDSGDYGCVVEGPEGPQIVRRVSLKVLPPAPRLREEETNRTDTVADDSSSGLLGSASPETSLDTKSIPLIWGAVVLLGLLVVAVILFAVMAKRRGNRLAAGAQFQSSRVSSLEQHASCSVGQHVGDSTLAAELPSNVPYVRLDSPPSFDNATYTSLPLDPLSGKPPSRPPSPPLPPKAPSAPSL